MMLGRQPGVPTTRKVFTGGFKRKISSDQTELKYRTLKPILNHM